MQFITKVSQLNPLGMRHPSSPLNKSFVVPLISPLQKTILIFVYSANQSSEGKSLNDQNQINQDLMP